MKLAAIFEQVQKQKFRPLVFALDSGDRFLLSHPDNLNFYPNRAKIEYLYVYDSDARRGHFFEPEVVTCIEPGKRNGRHRRARR